MSEPELCENCGGAGFVEVVAEYIEGVPRMEREGCIQCFLDDAPPVPHPFKVLFSTADIVAERDRLRTALTAAQSALDAAKARNAELVDAIYRPHLASLTPDELEGAEARALLAHRSDAEAGPKPPVHKCATCNGTGDDPRMHGTGPGTGEEEKS